MRANSRCCIAVDIILSGLAGRGARQRESRSAVYLGERGMTGQLEVENLHAYYGSSHILFGISLEVQPGESRLSARPQRRRQNRPR